MATAIPLLLVLAVLLGGCTGGSGSAGAEAPTEREVREIAAPPIPDATEPAARPLPTPDEAPSPAPAAEVAGGHVLVHLEGPITDRAATDVVVRTAEGLELERFRLEGAVGVYADPSGGSWALVSTLGDRWAVMDATGLALSLLTFTGAVPAGTPTVHGVTAVWPDGGDPVAVRLDTREVLDVAQLAGDGFTVAATSADGGALLLTGPRTLVLDTTSGQVREPPPGEQVALSPDGVVAAVQQQAGDALLTVEAADGRDRREVARLRGSGRPVPLPDGGVLVLDAASVVVGPDGSVRELDAPIASVGPPVVGAGGRVVVVPTADGLGIVDVATATVRTVPDTAGFRPHAHPRPAHVWAVSGEAGTTGAVVVDAASGEARRLLPDVQTTSISSASADLARVAIRTGAGGTGTVVATADGQARPAAGDADVVDVAVHPSEPTSAVATVDGSSRALLLGPLGTPLLTAETGRSPVWLAAASPTPVRRPS